MGSIGGDDQSAKAADPGHALVIPLHNQGHVTPLLRLATQLAQEGITITFVSFQDKIDQITLAEDGSGTKLQALGFRFFGLSLPDDFVQRPGCPTKFLSKNLRNAFTPLTEQLMRDKRTGIDGPTFVLSDMYLPWTQELADTLEIPRYMFVPSGVIFARAMHGLMKYFESGQFQISDEEDGGKLVHFDWKVSLPGLPPLCYDELPLACRIDTCEFRARCASVEKAAGLLVNSFLELEGNVIETWRNTEGNSKVPKTYPVGPLFSVSVALPNLKVSKELEDAESKCLNFLNSQAPSSVVYIAFGSQVRLGPEQVKELALGLQESQQPFLWVIPTSKDDTLSLDELLPEGLQELVEGRGCIVSGWAPQVAILAHSSTGGFLMHTGWNSCLESISTGLPMIACPYGSEQHLNCRYLVDDLKIAVELATGPEHVFKRDEVARAVRRLMVESEEKAEMRRRVQELSMAFTAAAAEGGSKAKILRQFLADVRQYRLSPVVSEADKLIGAGSQLIPIVKNESKRVGPLLEAQLST